MYEAALLYRHIAEARGGALARDWPSRSFALATVHRAENTDDGERLSQIIHALNRISATVCPVLWPVHPRTRKRIREMGCSTSSITTIDPISYLDMLLLEGRARFILTDSGGVQREACFFRVPCITLRDETKWQETLENHCNNVRSNESWKQQPPSPKSVPGARATETATPPIRSWTPFLIVWRRRVRLPTDFLHVFSASAQLRKRFSAVGPHSASSSSISPQR